MAIFNFILYFIGLHTSFTLYPAPDFPLPFTLCFVASLLALPAIYRQTKQITWYEAWPILSYILLAILVTGAAAQHEYYYKSIRGCGQLLYSVWMAWGLYSTIRDIPAIRLSWVCTFLLCAIAILGMLEQYTPIRSLSDKARAAIDAGGMMGGVYDGDMRDIALHGSIRAKVFALEPSHVGISFFWLLMVAIWTGRAGRTQIGLWLGATLLALWAIRSPILLAATVFGFVLTVFVRRGRMLQGRSIEVQIAPLLIGVLMTSAIIYFTWDFFVERAESVLTGEGSFMQRVSGPWYFVTEYLPQHMLVGSGVVGDLDMYSDQLLGMYREMGLSWMTGEYVGKTISNCLGLHFIYFGAVGGGLALYLLYRSVWIEWRHGLLLLLGQCLAIWMMMGGYNAGRMWCSAAAVVAAARLFRDARERSSVSMGFASSGLRDKVRSPNLSPRLASKTAMP